MFTLEAIENEINEVKTRYNKLQKNLIDWEGIVNNLYDNLAILENDEPNHDAFDEAFNKALDQAYTSYDEAYEMQRELEDELENVEEQLNLLLNLRQFYR